MAKKERAGLVVINGSYRPPQVSFTYRCLVAEAERLAEKHNIKRINYYTIPDDFAGCRHCAECVTGCKFADDYFATILDDIKHAKRVMFGSPVYLDFPSPKLLAFLSRLVCMAENTRREFFRGKKAVCLATAWCSGTKSVIHSLMGACEMLGFDIDGRSSKEFIQLWKDDKVRGGMGPDDACYIER